MSETETEALARWLENDALFREQWEIGNTTVRRVAERLRGLGLTVEVTEPTFRDTVAERHRFTANDVDLKVAGLAIEVKGRKLAFAGPLDFPHPEVFVDTTAGWRAKKQKPVAVVVASVSETSGMLVIPTSTEPSWKIHRRKDQVRGIIDSFYAVDRSMCRTIEELAQWLIDQGPRKSTGPRFCPPPICRREDLDRIKAGKDPIVSSVQPGETIAFKCRRCGLVYPPRDVVGRL